jgi:hypothetical protein
VFTIDERGSSDNERRNSSIAWVEALFRREQSKREKVMRAAEFAGANI